MGTVIRFPDEKRPSSHKDVVHDGPASIIILPVVRIERHTESGSDLLTVPKSAGGRRRRRRPGDLERDAS